MIWMETAPLWLVAGGVFALLLVGAEAGYRGRRWLRSRERERPLAADGQDHLLSAALGLLALLLGFTFSLALSRHEARRDLVLQEANALGTLWLRVQLLEEPGRSLMAPLLRAYVDERLEWSENNWESLGVRSNDIQQKLWTAMGVVLRAESVQGLSRSVMEAMNAAFDLASSRAMARATHIPDRVLQVLLLYAVLSVVMLGYIFGANWRPHRLATALLLVLLTLAIVVILDIDRPRSGAIQVSQLPMEALKESIRSSADLPDPDRKRDNP